MPEAGSVAAAPVEENKCMGVLRCREGVDGERVRISFGRHGYGG